MPDRVLSGSDDRPAVGFFGKLPTTGDFVARGLPDGFRRKWDAWVTRHLAPRLRDGATWPDGGVRFRLRSGGVDGAGVVVPGSDSAGRLFPLSLILVGGDLPGPRGFDPWCDAAVEAARAAESPDALWLALDALASPEGEGDAAPFLVWSRGATPAAADPDAPDAALDRACFSSG